MELGATIVESSDEDRCEFCLKLPEEEQQIAVPSSEEVTIRGTIEFVLGVDMDHGGGLGPLHCCLTCWVTFESFYDFKSTCLASIKARQKILSGIKHDPEGSERPAARFAAVSCGRCQEQFNSKTELDEHVARYCFEPSEDLELVVEVEDTKPQTRKASSDLEEDEYEVASDEKNQQRVFPENFIFCCQRCKQIFHELGQLQKHKELCSVPLLKSNPEEIEPNEEGVIEYQCELCPSAYTKKQLLKFHMNKHYDEAKFVCRKGCEKSFYFPSNRSNHETNCTANTNQKPPIEQAEPRPVAELERLRKRKLVYPEGFIWCCSQCKAQFTVLAELNQHKQDCFVEAETSHDFEPDADGLLWCPLCPYSSYKIGGLLAAHMNRHYDERRFTCRVREGCPRAFFGPSLRSLHEKDCRKESGYICDECGEELKSRDTLRVHKQGHGHDKFQCMICDKKFKQRNNYTAHWRTHFTIRGNPEPVMHSDANIANVEHLPLEVTCELCTRGLPTHSIYVRHRRYCNQPEEPKPTNYIQCPQCPKAFMSQDRYVEHINKHKGVRTVPCRKEGCTSMFFDIHVRKAHETNCGKKWMCNVCGIVFSQKLTLNEHLETHSDKPPTCEVCNKVFSGRKSLKVHMITHTKEKNYGCPICDRRFTQNSSVKTHLKTHTQEEKDNIGLTEMMRCKRVFYASDQ